MPSNPSSKNRRMDHGPVALLPERLPLSFHMPEDAVPMRLDAAIGRILPDLGLRARRRLWEWCRISVNGKAQKPGFVARPGDSIAVSAVERNSGSLQCADTVKQGPGQNAFRAGHDAVHLLPVAMTRDFIALYKPAGMHSGHIDGGRDASLETELARRWPELKRTLFAELQKASPGHSFPAGDTSERPAQGAKAGPLLLTRLDRATSGIVLAALNPEAATAFRRLEKQGGVRKTYLALVRGRLETSLDLRRMLDTDGGKQSRVLPVDDPDPARHSHVQALRVLKDDDLRRAGPALTGEATLVKVTIARGARHQIRAHLANAGFPIVGEWLYSPAEKEGRGTLFLHHAKVEFPGLTACRLPDWNFLRDDKAGALLQQVLAELGVTDGERTELIS